MIQGSERNPLQGQILGPDDSLERMVTCGIGDRRGPGSSFIKRPKNDEQFLSSKPGVLIGETDVSKSTGGAEGVIGAVSTERWALVRPHDCPHRLRYRPGLSPAQHVERRERKQQQWHTVTPYVIGAVAATALVAGGPRLWHWLHPSAPAPAADSTCVPIGEGATALAAVFQHAYEAAGGKAAVGCGLDAAHVWGQGTTQDLRGGRAQRAAIMSFTPDKTVVLSGDEWSAYVAIGGGQTADLAGYPIAKRRWGKSFVIDLFHEPNRPSAMLRQDGGPFFWIPAPLWERYVSLGGPAGQLGFPISPPEGSYENGWHQKFGHGSMASYPDASVTVSP
jgi:uncharacterized protein with LGFP repeats